MPDYFTRPIQSGRHNEAFGGCRKLQPSSRWWETWAIAGLLAAAGAGAVLAIWSILL